MKKVLKVAKHEFKVNVRRKEFLFGVFGLPIFIALVFLLPALFVQIEPKEVKAGFVDKSGLIRSDKIYKEFVEKSTFPIKFTNEYVVMIVRFKTEEEAYNALKSEEVSCYYVIPEDFKRSFKVKKVYVRECYRCDKLMSVELAKSLGGEIAAKFAEGLKFEEVSVKGKGGILNFTVPFTFGMLLFISILTTSSYLMQGIIEEKESRIIEILLTSVHPNELFLGKLLGLGALGFVQISIWLTLILFASTLFTALKLVSFEIIVISLIYFILGYILYSSITAFIAAISPTLKDAQQLLPIVVFIPLTPIIFSGLLIYNPESDFARFFALIPLTSPIVMPIRFALIGMNALELVTSLIILVLTTVVVVKISSKVFELYALSYTKPKLRDVLKKLSKS